MPLPIIVFGTPDSREHPSYGFGGKRPSFISAIMNNFREFAIPVEPTAHPVRLLRMIFRECDAQTSRFKSCEAADHAPASGKHRRLASRNAEALR